MLRYILNYLLIQQDQNFFAFFLRLIIVREVCFIIAT